MKTSYNYILGIVLCLFACFVVYDPFLFTKWKIFDFNKIQIKLNNVFTAEELSQFKGLNELNGKKIYLAIIGNIYDVTKGVQHYGPGGAYHVFAGRDVSRAFVTGEFAEDKLTDAVLDLSPTELRSLDDWNKFYAREYKFIGKLIGRYYDENGDSTSYSQALEERIKEAEKLDINKLKQQRIYPPCNVEWDSERGTRVWCTPNSGGISRQWTGVPRKLYEPGSKTHRCACIAPEFMSQGNIEEYRNCRSDSDSCYVYDA